MRHRAHFGHLSPIVFVESLDIELRAIMAHSTPQAPYASLELTTAFRLQLNRNTDTSHVLEKGTFQIRKRAAFRGGMAVDYSLYLVTDSTRPILGDRDLVEVVRSAIAGGKEFWT